MSTKHIELSDYLNGHRSQWSHPFLSCPELGNGQAYDWTCLSGGWMTGRVGGVTLWVYLTHLAEFHAALTKYSDNWPPYPLYKSSLAPLPCQLLKGTFRPVWRGSGPIQWTQRLAQRRFNVGPASSTLARHWTVFGGTWGSNPSCPGWVPLCPVSSAQLLEGGSWDDRPKYNYPGVTPPWHAFKHPPSEFP